MLHVASGFRPTAAVRPGLIQIEAELDLSTHQRAAWDVFVETFDWVRNDLDALEAIVGVRCDDRAPGLRDALGMQAERVAARLSAVRHLESAAQNLYRTLSSRQRTRADRMLSVLCGEIGCVPRAVC